MEITYFFAMPNVMSDFHAFCYQEAITDNLLSELYHAKTAEMIKISIIPTV